MNFYVTGILVTIVILAWAKHKKQDAYNRILQKSGRGMTYFTSAVVCIAWPFSFLAVATLLVQKYLK